MQLWLRNVPSYPRLAHSSYDRKFFLSTLGDSLPLYSILIISLLLSPSLRSFYSLALSSHRFSISAAATFSPCSVYSQFHLLSFSISLTYSRLFIDSFCSLSLFWVLFAFSFVR